MINSNFGPIFHRFRDTATYSLKLFIEKFRQITINSLKEVASALSDSIVADSPTT